MLIEVNLLPEKHKRDITSLFIFLIGLVVIIGVGITLWSVYYQSSSKANHIEQELYNVKLLSEATRNQLSEGMVNDVERLQETVSILEKNVIPASFVLDHLVSLLPERGFFLSYEYKQPFEVTVDIRFDELSEIAQYIYHLNESPMIVNVKTPSIMTEMISDDFQDSDTYLPRYVASFTIVLNVDEIREARDV